jgi:16S rRNA (guanine527-N7)-methyltransferase
MGKNVFRLSFRLQPWLALSASLFSIGGLPLAEQILLQQGALALDVRLSTAQLAMFASLSSALTEWNRQVNLTGLVDPDQIELKHFLDSLTLVPHLPALLPLQRARLIDVGSGPGFPGLPLAIALSHLHVTLLEATGKKVSFLRHAVELLGLENARPLHGRAEEAGRLLDHREAYDVAVVRALAGTAALTELLMPLVRVGGYAVLMKKQSNVEDEVADARPALQALNASVEDVIPVDVPGLLEDRALVVIKKLSVTSERFPRRPGVPQRRPLRESA